MPMFARMRLRSLLAPIDATPLGLRWGRPVSRKELDDYQRWRQEIELSADEIAVGLPALPNGTVRWPERKSQRVRGADGRL
jgi:hypothetical protein